MESSEDRFVRVCVCNASRMSRKSQTHSGASLSTLSIDWGDSNLRLAITSTGTHLASDRTAWRRRAQHGVDMSAESEDRNHHHVHEAETSLR